MLFKKFGSMLLALTLVLACIPGTMASAADSWVHVEAEAGMGTTQHSPAGYGVSNNSGLVGHNHPGDGAYLGAENTITVSVPAAGEYSVFAIVGKGDVNDKGDSRGSYKFSIDGTSFFESGVGTSISPISASFKQISLSIDTYAQRLYWINAGKVTLPEGDVSLKLEITNHGIIDCVRFVPSSWNWVPTGANLDDPYDMTPVLAGNSYLDMEAERGVLEGSMSFSTLAQASGGAYVASKSTGSVGSTTLSFKASESGKYDVWAALGTVSGNYLGGYVVTIDTTETYNKCLSQVDRTGQDLYNGTTVTLHTGDSNGSKATVRWVKVASKQNLTADKHAIKVSTRVGSGATNKTGLVDCVRIVPSDWEWTPENSGFAAPAKLSKDRGYIWIEGEDMTPVNEHAKEVSVGVAGGTPSGGREIYRNARGSGDAEFVPEFTVDFYVENAGTYDIWNYGYVVGGGTHFGSMVATVNGVTTTGRSNYEKVVSGEKGTDNQEKRWDRLTPPEGQQITLQAGWNTLTVKYLYYGIHNLFCTDAIAIVPASWGWVPESMLEGENVVNAYKMAPKLDVFSIGKSLAAQSGTVTENLTLADRGAAGSTITYVSTNSAISNTGVVTIPSRWDGDAVGTIVATATKGALSASSDAVNFTVEAADALLSYSKFEIIGDVESEGFVYAVANDVESAHADAKTAVVILAVYQGDALIGVYPSAVTDITDGAQTIVSSMAKLPKDVTGVTVKAFIWNGLETAMPYVLPISK